MRKPPATPWSTVTAAARHDGGPIVAEAREAPGAATFVAQPRELNPLLAEALAKAGIERLYAHQAGAFETAINDDLIVTTGTASGKSLCFNLPVLHTLLSDPRSRAIYLYPTKALAQDQARKLGELGLPGNRLRYALYDGDTPQTQRRELRDRANLILTNPDMLNVGILPHHRQWGDLFANLACVVIDEAHVYRGVFGSHVANVLRRLRRIAAAYGTRPRFIMTSATIANPRELAGALTGLEFELIDRDAAPRAAREILLWNPPLLDERSGRRASALSEAATLLADLVRADVRTICFMRSRRAVELIQKFAAEQLARDDPRLAEKITAYRGGYTSAQRRAIERRLVNGELLGVVATNALELGIDIGGLDAAICVTFPGTVASLRQMWGRAGRREHGLAVFVAGEDALDQFFCRHPDQFLDRPVEAAILDFENESIHLRHLRAAAFELPISPRDGEYFGPRLAEHCGMLVAAGELREHGGRYLPRGDAFPAAEIALRSASPDRFSIVESGGGEVIGTVEAERAFATTHPGAVYLHMGVSYEVRELEIDRRRVLVDSFSGDWYTQPKLEIETFIERVDAERTVAGAAGGFELSFGAVSVTEQVIAFQRKSLADHEVISLEAVDLPEQNFLTQALWFEPGEGAVGELPLDVLQGALHAAEHAQIAVLPLLAMCDRWDIGGLSTAYHHQTGGPTIFIYDGHPGGVGITRRGFDLFETLVANALRLIAECGCERGCPSCVQSPKCGNLNEPLHKSGARDLLRNLAPSGVPAAV